MCDPVQADHERLKSLLARLDPMDAVERAAVLRAEVGDEPELRSRLEALLEASDATDESLFRPVVAARETEPQDPLPSHIGPYAIQGLLGRGGMACVFEAWQDWPIRRRVALKVVRPALDGASVLGRFDSERKALERLRHRNIAQVLDAGADPYGPPWFAMELVDGPPITTFCTERSLAFEKRLRLFVQVCRGVHHAHQRGILHRDLKPSNILVAIEDGEAVPKIIDFGVAKALGADAPLSTERHTLDTQIVGTLEYMSPEQARFGNPDVDIRADVYALGVVLYQLVTGTVPIGGDAFEGVALDVVQSLIQTRKPPKPSSLAKLPPEFDCVILKALEKEPDDRYSSARAFAEDVERFLVGEPLSVRAPTAVYVARKFAARHKALVGVIILVGFLVILGLIGTSIGLYRESVANARLAKSLDDLELKDAALSASLANAVQLNKTYERVFLEIAPNRKGRDVTLHEAIVGTADALDRPNAHRDFVTSKLAAALVASLGTLGEHELAVRAGTIALAAMNAGTIPDDLKQRVRVHDRMATAYYNMGQSDKAQAHVRTQIALADEHPDALRQVRYRARIRLAEKLDGRLGFKAGLAMKHEALELLQKIEPENVAMQARLLAQIGRSYGGMGDLKRALEYAGRALRLRESASEEPSHDLVVLRQTVGLIAMDARDFRRAVEVFEPAVEDATELHGLDSSLTLYLRVVLCYAWACARMKPMHEILAVLRPAIATAKREQPPRLHMPLEAYAINTTAVLGRHAQARAAGDRVLARSAVLFGEQDDFHLKLRMQIVFGRLEHGVMDIADPALESLWADLTKKYGASHPLTIRVRTALDELRK